MKLRPFPAAPESGAFAGLSGHASPPRASLGALRRPASTYDDINFDRRSGRRLVQDGDEVEDWESVRRRDDDVHGPLTMNSKAEEKCGYRGKGKEV